MTDSPIEEIKSKLDIVEVVKEYVNLEKTGSNHRAPCPFHHEKTPSFFVNQSRQLWRCFGGCNEGGDIFKFIMKIEGVEFGDALRMLANKANVELKRERPEVETKKKRLFDICDLSTLFFERQLHNSKGGEKAKQYLLERKISEESIKKWRVGYAPTAKDSLSKFLIGEGYNREEIKEAGVAVGKGNAIYDRFRARIIFPISNLSGFPIGFGGRVLFKKDERAKYINTPVTPLYDKSAVLYGLHLAKIGIRRRGFATLVEGYTDVILCHQAGYENVISSSGTAITLKQLDILGRYTRSIFTAFDMDEAGGSATKKGIDLALRRDFEVRVIMMPEEKDPADIVSHDPNKWEEYVRGAKPVMEFYFKNILSKYDLSDPRKKGEAAKELLKEIKKVKNSIERSHFLSRLAERLGVSEESVLEEMERMAPEEKEERKEAVSEDHNKKKSGEKTRKEKLEERIAAVCAKNESFAKMVNKEDISYLSDNIASILLYLKKEKDALSEKERDFFDYLCLLPEENETEDREKELKICIREMKKESIREKMRDLERKIKEEKDEKEQEELMKKHTHYSQELQKL